MMKITHVFLICLMMVCVACKRDSNTPNDGGDTNDQVTDTNVNARQVSPIIKEATQLVESFYGDMNEERLDASQYFAETVRRYYSQEDKSNEEIAGIMEKNMGMVAEKKVLIDRSSMEVTDMNGEYEVIFGGTVSIRQTPDAEITVEPFKNRWVLDSDMKIVEYETVQEDKSIRRTGNSEEARAMATTVQNVMRMMQLGKYSQLQKFIDEEMGFYFIIRPGAIDAVHHYQEVDQIFQEYKALPTDLWKDARCFVTLKEIPEFSCDEEFAEEGCFLNGVEGYNRLSTLMNTLQEYGMTKYQEADFEQARGFEEKITLNLVSTKDSGLSLYFGMVNGSLKLLIIDMAEYDCQA